jgi:hypothetical protein
MGDSVCDEVGEAARFEGCRKRRKEFLITGSRKPKVSPQGIDQKLLTSFSTISWVVFCRFDGVEHGDSILNRRITAFWVEGLFYGCGYFWQGVSAAP